MPRIAWKMGAHRRGCPGKRGPLREIAIECLRQALSTRKLWAAVNEAMQTLKGSPVALLVLAQPQLAGPVLHSPSPVPVVRPVKQSGGMHMCCSKQELHSVSSVLGCS